MSIPELMFTNMKHHQYAQGFKYFSFTNFDFELRNFVRVSFCRKSTQEIGALGITFAVNFRLFKHLENVET